MAKIGRSDIHQLDPVLSTRVKEPSDTYWKNLVRMIQYLNGGNKKYLTWSADYLKVIEWYVNFFCSPSFQESYRSDCEYGTVRDAVTFQGK